MLIYCNPNNLPTTTTNLTDKLVVVVVAAAAAKYEIRVAALGVRCLSGHPGGPAARQPAIWLVLKLNKPATLAWPDQHWYAPL